MYKNRFGINDLQWLMRHKNKPNFKFPLGFLYDLNFLLRTKYFSIFTIFFLNFWIVVRLKFAKSKRLGVTE